MSHNSPYPHQQYPQQPGGPVPGHYPAPPPPAPRKRRTWPWVVAALVAAFVIIGVANGGGDSPSDQPLGVAAGNDAAKPAAKPADEPAAKPAAPTERVVIYRVTGTGTATSITYTTDGMTTMNQESDVALPWEKTIRLPAGEALQMVSIVAQGNGNGNIDVTIEVDGKPFKEAHAEGYGVASANGNIGTMG